MAVADVEDFYELLGVSRNATEVEIKRAYLRLAKELHPDAKPGDQQAEDTFKKVNFAYETLSDPERRRQYDMFGPAGVRGSGAAGTGTGDPFSGFGAGLGDLFDAFFGGSAASGGARAQRAGGPRRGEDAEARLVLEFSEAVFGTQKEMSVRVPRMCATCGGSGTAPGTAPVTCATCHGSGELRRVRQSILGQMVTSTPCSHCGGSGQQIKTPCADCRGRGRRPEEQRFTVEVPPGVDHGSTLRLPGRGAGGAQGGPAGDLYVHLQVRDHRVFTRRGSDLLAVVHVALTQAALGTSFPFETLDGEEELTVPAGTATGHEIRLRGRGVPHLQGRGRGDLLVTIVVDTPHDLSREQEDLLRQLAAMRGEQVSDQGGGLRSRLKSAFK